MSLSVILREPVPTVMIPVTRASPTTTNAVFAEPTVPHTLAPPTVVDSFSPLL